MGVLAPAPVTLGFVPITAAVGLVCIVNIIVCATILANVSSVTALQLSGVTISPLLQCVTGAWCLLGVPAAIIGGVGALYRVETNLNIYMAYLLASIIGLAVWVAIFASASTGALSSVLSLVWVSIFILCICFGLYLVWSMKDYIAQRLETELIRYQEPWALAAQLADDTAAAAALQAKQLSQAAAENSFAFSQVRSPNFWTMPPPAAAPAPARY